MKIYTDLEHSPEELTAIVEEHRHSAYLLLKEMLPTILIWPLLMLWTFWSEVSHALAITWFCAFLATVFTRHYLLFVWYKATQSEASHRLFERATLTLTFVAACLWGATLQLMNFETLAAETVFLNFVLCSLVTASIGVASYWRAYFWAYTLPMLVFFGGTFLVGVPEPHYILFACSILWTIFIKHMINTTHQKNVENILLRNRNERLANKLEMQKNQAEVLAESRKNFLAAASHDLRQPLQAMNFFLTAIKPSITDEQGSRLFRQLEDSTDNMNELLLCMLDISKLDAKTMQIQPTVIDICSVLASIEQQFKPIAVSHGLNFDIKMAAVKASNQQHINVFTDQVLLSRIISNLVANAINYTEFGSVCVNLSVEGQKLNVEVVDSGIGIADEKQLQIFDEFFQIGNIERDRKKGLGLGLSIVQRLCKLLDLEIKLKSSLGQGSCFTLTIPLTELPSLPIAAPQEITNLSGNTILIIEDEISVRESLKALLKQWGCHVIDAESGKLAVESLVNSDKVDIIISDYRLRDQETGIDAINLVKTSLGGADIPALIISGDTAPERLQEVAASGYNLLHKPVKPAHLRSALQRLILN